jgi:hypothetical protein
VRADIADLQARVSRETGLLQSEMRRGGAPRKFLVGVGISVGIVCLTAAVAAVCFAAWLVLLIGVAAAGVGVC